MGDSGRSVGESAGYAPWNSVEWEMTGKFSTKALVQPVFEVEIRLLARDLLRFGV